MRIWILRKQRNEFGKMIRRGYEHKTIKAKYSDIHDWCPRPPEICPTITTCVTLDTLILERRDEG